MSVIKAIEFPERTFKTKEDLFLALKENCEKIIGIKKAQIYKSFRKKAAIIMTPSKVNEVFKGSIEAKENHIYPVISTTRYMDSHKDCHFDGCFNKTVKEQQGNISYAMDHQLKYDSIIAWPENVKMFVANLDWAIVGKNYSGKTEALVFEIAKENIRRKDVLADIEDRAHKFENSIRMIYHKIVLGINSKNKDLKTELKYYNERIDSISNKDKVEKEGYFWGIEELGIHKEGSLVVAGGSNDATTIYNKEIEPDNTTQKDEPSGDTQKDKKTFFRNLS